MAGASTLHVPSPVGTQDSGCTSGMNVLVDWFSALHIFMFWSMCVLGDTFSDGNDLDASTPRKDTAEVIRLRSIRATTPQLVVNECHVRRVPGLKQDELAQYLERLAALPAADTSSAYASIG